MSDMSRVSFSANGTQNLGPIPGNSLMLNLSGSLGGGTFNVKKYHGEIDAYVTVAAFSTLPTEAQEIVLGRGARYQLELIGATGPSLNADRWVV